jgi:hydrogenase expression/formation protein HypE
MDWLCPLPLRDYPSIVLGHGGGGQLSNELVEHLFLPAFGNPALGELSDSAVVTVPAGRLAMSTDSFVVRPLIFPGGSIGDLAINGTVNDLAMSGARPLYLTAGFILEEGLALDMLSQIVQRMAAAARRAGVLIVTGDTKVVERGHGDGVYINTSGIGVIPDNVRLSPSQARPGDAVLLSGTLGDHGVAVMSVREGLEFGTVIESDCQPLHELTALILEDPAAVRVMRDPTRGGLSATLNELAGRSKVGIMIEDRLLPIRPDVQSACELLGLDPLLVANEGKLVAIVDAGAADAILARMRSHPAGRDACWIGRVTKENPGRLIAKTALGTSRLIPLPIGEQLPRIC